MTTKTCLVTGAGQGIGRAIALHFAARGANVVLAEQKAETGEAVASEIAAAGGSALLVETDVADPQSVRTMITRATAKFGRIDILISNARWSGLASTPVQDITDADWQRAMDVNVTGAFHCVRSVVPGMIEAGWGRIVILSSSTVLSPPARRPYVHYLSTKAALIGMTRALAVELGAHGITVNAILPGSVETGAARPSPVTTEQREQRA